MHPMRTWKPMKEPITINYLIHQEPILWKCTTYSYGLQIMHAQVWWIGILFHLPIKVDKNNICLIIATTISSFIISDNYWFIYFKVEAPIIDHLTYFGTNGEE